MRRAKKATSVEALGAALKKANENSAADRATEETLVRLRSYPLAEAQVEPFLRAAGRVPALGEKVLPHLRSILVAVYLQGALDTRNAMEPTGSK